MRHALTVALQGYEGALVVVSHDRFLLQSVADKLLRVHDGSAGPYDGDLDDYANWLAERRRRMDEPEPMPAGPNRKDQRRAEAEKRRQLQPLKKQLVQLEAKLEQLGAEKSRLDLMLADNTLYSASEKDKLKALLLDQARLQQQLVDTESAWLQACETLETASRD